MRGRLIYNCYNILICCFQFSCEQKFVCPFRLVFPFAGSLCWPVPLVSVVPFVSVPLSVVVVLFGVCPGVCPFLCRRSLSVSSPCLMPVHHGLFPFGVPLPPLQSTFQKTGNEKWLRICYRSVAE